MGERAIFVCTPSLTGSAAAGRIRESLGSMLVAEFSQVAPHVPMPAAEAARVLAASRRIDVAVALGGGSAIGVAKSLALPSLQPPLAPPALIAVPTTYAGSEMTAVVGITDPRSGHKRVVRDPAVLPALAVYDPELTLELPPELTAGTGMNALAHGVEAGYAPDRSPLVEAVALEAIHRILGWLPACVTNGHDVEAREELLIGAHLAGFSLANAGMALHHGLCHALGGRTGVGHGTLNAIVLPHAMGFNRAFLPAHSLTEQVSALVEKLPLPRRLRDAGVPESILPAVAADAAASSTVRSNPRPASEAEILELLRAAW